MASTVSAISIRDRLSRTSSEVRQPGYVLCGGTSLKTAREAAGQCGRLGTKKCKAHGQRACERSTTICIIGCKEADGLDLTPGSRCKKRTRPFAVSGHRDALCFPCMNACVGVDQKVLARSYVYCHVWRFTRHEVERPEGRSERPEGHAAQSSGQRDALCGASEIRFIVGGLSIENRCSLSYIARQ